jgi:hypothetical protein
MSPSLASAMMKSAGVYVPAWIGELVEDAHRPSLGGWVKRA